MTMEEFIALMELAITFAEKRPQTSKQEFFDGLKAMDEVLKKRLVLAQGEVAMESEAAAWKRG